MGATHPLALSSSSLTMELVLFFCALLALLFFMSRGKSLSPPTSEAPAAPKAAAPVVEKAKAPVVEEAKVEEVKQPPAIPDLEDLKPLKSLVKETVREMKRNGVTPYTLEEREGRLRELNEMPEVPNFSSTILKSGEKLKRTNTVVLQANIGLYCNQACTHCHVDSSPKRKEMMSKAVTERCIEVMKSSPSIKVVDLTGGAPELNREFRTWVIESRKLGFEVIDRCNLTVLSEPGQEGLAQFLADHQVHIIASLPCYLEDNVDSQRGNSVFTRSIRGLRMLNAVGYGTDPGRANGLVLDLVYNPTGVHLPPPQEKLQVAYDKHLMEKYQITFDKLHCITNMPINRFYDHLKNNGDLEKYMDILVQNFNPSTVGGLMCRDYVSIKWDGTIYDCDFNQQVELFPKAGKPLTVFDINCTDDILQVGIATGKHCYGCTAGAGSK